MPAIELILGSGSESRRSVLEQFQIPFSVIVPDIEEIPLPYELPQDYVLRLSQEKADKVASLLSSARPDLSQSDTEDFWIIAADQTAVCEGKIYEKPAHLEDLIDFFRAFSGKTVSYISGLTLLSYRTKKRQSGVFYSHTHMRPFGLQDILNYAALDPLYTQAASGMRMRGPGGLLIQSIETSDPFALVGMPIYLLNDFCQQWGYNLFDFVSDSLKKPNNLREKCVQPL